MPHQLESWYPRRCRRRGRFRVTPWRLGLDRLLAPQGHPFGRSVSRCNWHQGHMSHSSPVNSQGTSNPCTDGHDQGGQRPHTLLMPPPPTERSPPFCC